MHRSPPVWAKKVMQKVQPPAIVVVTNVTSDVSQPSLMLQTRDGSRYILGRLGEGFQRMLAEHRLKSSKLQGIFLTGQLKWASIAGLPGYCLSLHGVFQQAIKLYTAVPDKFAKIFRSFGRFITHTPISIDDASTEPYSDDHVEIDPVLVGDSSCLIVQMQPTRGKFDVSMAKALGVPPGPLYSQLSSGNPVTLPSGQVVSPHQVVGPTPTPSRILILDLPTDKHVELASSKIWNARGKRKRNSKDYNVSIHAVYYFLGPEVDPDGVGLTGLIKSLDSTGPDIEHYISHKTSTPDVPALQSFTKFQAELRDVCPDNFSVPYCNSSATNVSRGDRVKSMHQVEALKLTAPDLVEIKSEDNATELLNEPAVEPISEPQIITLGTGGGLPSKYRNVSGTLVRVPDANGAIKSVLFDCGEGTANTLRRLYGPSALHHILQEVDLLYVSHMHADHHLGCLELIKEWMLANPSPKILNVAGPTRLLNFFNDWKAIDETELELSRIRFVDLAEACVGKGYYPHMQKERPIFDGFSLESCRALHCPFSYCGAVTFNSGFKVSYSGDTRQNKFFADTIGKNSDLLIHEATHDDELAQEAYEKHHSTVSQAIEIANRMNAKHTILTHLSQRYPRFPAVASFESNAEPICFAFDTMKVSLSGISELHKAMPSLNNVLEKVADDDE